MLITKLLNQRCMFGIYLLLDLIFFLIKEIYRLKQQFGTGYPSRRVSLDEALINIYEFKTHNYSKEKHCCTMCMYATKCTRLFIRLLSLPLVCNAKSICLCKFLALRILASIYEILSIVLYKHKKCKKRIIS